METRSCCSSEFSMSKRNRQNLSSPLKGNNALQDAKFLQQSVSKNGLSEVGRFCVFLDDSLSTRQGVQKSVGMKSNSLFMACGKAKYDIATIVV